MKPRNIILATIVLAFGSGCANRQGAAAFYQAQEEARQPLFRIVGQLQPDGTQAPVRMEFGEMEIYAPEDVQQFREDDRAVRIAETTVRAAALGFGIYQAGQTVQAAYDRPAIQPQVVQLPAPEVIQLPAPEVIFAP